MILGWIFYSFLMRFFWVTMTVWFFCAFAMFIWCYNFDRIASYAVEHWGAREINFMDGEGRAFAILWDEPEEGEEPLEIFVHSLGAGVSVPNTQQGLSPDDPLAVLVCVMFPFLSWIYLAFFTVGETIVRKKKGLIHSIVGILTLFLPWTIPRYFKKHKRRFWFPFHISQRRDTTAKRRICLFVFYVLCGTAATVIAFRTQNPQASLFSAWLPGGLGMICYAAILHCLVLCVIRRKSRNCRLDTYTCAAQHVCIGGVVYPLFPLLSSFVIYGVTSPAILWTALWLISVFVCVPIASAGYTATVVTAGIWFVAGVKVFIARLLKICRL